MLTYKVYCSFGDKKPVPVSVDPTMTPADVIPMLRIQEVNLKSNRFGLMIIDRQKQIQWLPKDTQFQKLIISPRDCLFAEPYEKITRVLLPDGTKEEFSLQMGIKTSQVVAQCCSHFGIWPPEVWAIFYESKGERKMFLPNLSIAEQSPAPTNLQLRQVCFSAALTSSIAYPRKIYLAQYRRMIIEKQFILTEEDLKNVSGYPWMKNPSLMLKFDASSASQAKEFEHLSELHGFGTITYGVRIHICNGEHQSEQLSRRFCISNTAVSIYQPGCPKPLAIRAISSIFSFAYFGPYLKISFDKDGSQAWFVMSHANTEILTILTGVLNPPKLVPRPDHESAIVTLTRYQDEEKTNAELTTYIDEDEVIKSLMQRANDTFASCVGMIKEGKHSVDLARKTCAFNSMLTEMKNFNSDTPSPLAELLETLYQQNSALQMPCSSKASSELMESMLEALEDEFGKAGENESRSESEEEEESDSGIVLGGKADIISILSAASTAAASKKISTLKPASSSKTDEEKEAEKMAFNASKEIESKKNKAEDEARMKMLKEDRRTESPTDFKKMKEICQQSDSSDAFSFEEDELDKNPPFTINASLSNTVPTVSNLGNVMSPLHETPTTLIDKKDSILNLPLQLSANTNALEKNPLLFANTAQLAQLNNPLQMTSPMALPLSSPMNMNGQMAFSQIPPMQSHPFTGQLQMPQQPNNIPLPFGFQNPPANTFGIPYGSPLPTYVVDGTNPQMQFGQMSTMIPPLSSPIRIGPQSVIDQTNSPAQNAPSSPGNVNVTLKVDNSKINGIKKGRKRKHSSDSSSDESSSSSSSSEYSDRKHRRQISRRRSEGAKKRKSLSRCRFVDYDGLSLKDLLGELERSIDIIEKCTESGDDSTDERDELRSIISSLRRSSERPEDKEAFSALLFAAERIANSPDMPSNKLGRLCETILNSIRLLLNEPEKPKAVPKFTSIPTAKLLLGCPTSINVGNVSAPKADEALQNSLNMLKSTINKAQQSFDVSIS